MVVPECRVAGLAYGDALQGKSYRDRSVHFSRPSFEAMINRDKPPAPFVKSPLMVHEALAAIRQPLQVDSLSLTNGLRLGIRKAHLLISILLPFAFLGLAFACNAAKPPNIIFITADYLGAGDLGCYGQKVDSDTAY